MSDHHDLPEDSLLPPPDKLLAHHRRQLSAMMDGELSPDAARFMLRRLEHDGDLAGCWERWQVCGDVLRGRRSSLLPADFPQRVAAGIAAGAVVNAQSTIAVAPASRPRRARWGGSAALAASVAVVAFMVARQLPGDGAPPDANPAPTTIAAAQAPSAPVAPLPVADASYMADAAPAEAGAGEAAAVAVATLAVAERPRRLAERRSQSRQVRRGALARSVDVAPAAVSGGAVPLLVDLPVDDAGALAAGPFATQPVAPARPWPRAVLPGALGTRTVSAAFGGDSAATGYDPFRPRVVPLAEPVSPVVPSPDADPATRQAGPADAQPTAVDDAGVPR